MPATITSTRTAIRARFAVAVALALLIPAATHARQVEPVEPPRLSVTGSATLKVAPDEARVVLSVVSEAEEARKAMEDNSRRMREVHEAMRRLGVGEKDLETISVALFPRYSSVRRDQDGAPRIIGYRAENQILVRTDKLELTGEIIQKGIEAGANRVSSLNFTLSDPDKHRRRAIAEAAASARSDAEALADAAGVRIVRVLRLEVVPTFPGPRTMHRAMAMEDTAAPPIEPGDVDVMAQVNIVYEVADADPRAGDRRSQLDRSLDPRLDARTLTDILRRWGAGSPPKAPSESPYPHTYTLIQPGDPFIYSGDPLNLADDPRGLRRDSYESVHPLLQLGVRPN